MHVVDNYKLVYYLGYEELGGQPEKYLLFDVEADPEEMKNLADDPKYAEVVKDLSAKLRASYK